MGSQIDQKQPNITHAVQKKRKVFSFKEMVESIFDAVDIKINGHRAWDVQVHDERLYQRIMTQGSLGIGESYMDGWWDCENLDEAVCRLLRAESEGRLKFVFRFSFPLSLCVFNAMVFNQQRRSKALEVGERHYDIGNELYRLMLDKRMVYTCAYWKNTNNLDDAQEAKLDLVCRCLQLKRGMHVLDIGCGWGSFANYAAQNYGVQVTGLTISRQQAELAEHMCRGLAVDIQFKDYRDVTGEFDRIVSLGMFEHVGAKNYRTYMRTVHRCLKDGGLFLLSTIGSNRSSASFDPWMNKYIFPNAMIPSIKQIGHAYEGLLIMEDWRNFSTYYDQTLMAWFKNFDANWANLRDRYDDRFYRMWKYYLLSCAGLFRSRREQVWQIVFSKYGVPQGWHGI